MCCLSGSNSAVKRGFSILTMMLSNRRLKTLYDLMNFPIALKIIKTGPKRKIWNTTTSSRNLPQWKIDEKEKLMNLVLIIQWNRNHLWVKIAICLAKKILTMNSLTKMNLCKIIFHVKFSIKIMLVNKQKLSLTMFFCPSYSFQIRTKYELEIKRCHVIMN